MRANYKYVISFIAEQLPGFVLTYAQTAPCGDEKQYRLRLAGKVNDEKITIFSSYTPNQIKAQVELDYRMILNKSNAHYIIDLKKI